MNDSWRMTLKIESPHGEVRFVRSVSLGDAIREGYVVPSIDPLSMASMESVVEALKERQAQPEKIEYAAVRLSRAMSDEIEDWAGWHGERRQDRMREIASGRLASKSQQFPSVQSNSTTGTGREQMTDKLGPDGKPWP